MDEMENAAGSADKEMDIIRDSLEFKINALKQTWVGTLQDITDRGDIGKIIDFLTTVSEGLSGVITNLGALKIALIGVGTVIGSQKLGLYSNDPNTIMGSIAQTKLDKAAYQRVLDLQKTSTDPDAILNARFDTALDMSNEVKANLQDIQKRIKAGVITTEQGITEINGLMGKSLSEGTALGKVFSRIGETILNGLVSLAISSAIALAVSGIEHLVNQAKYIEQAANEARNSINEVRGDLEKTSDTVTNLGSRYAELAQHVRNVGTASQSQGSLSNDEYQEFLNISNQLAEVFPTLTQGYTDNGDAIISLAGSVENITNKLNELYEAEQRAVDQKVFESMKDVWKKYQKDIDGTLFNGGIQDKREEIEATYNSGTIYADRNTKNIKKTIEQQQKDIMDIYNNNVYDKTLENSLDGYYEATRMAFEKVGLAYNDFFDLNGKQIKTFTLEDIKAINTGFKLVSKEYQDEIDRLDKQIENNNLEIAEDMLSSFRAESIDYDAYSDVQKKILESLARNYDFSNLVDENGAIKDWDVAFKTFREDLEKTLDLGSADLQTLSTTWENIMSLNLDEGVYGRNIEILREYLATIAQLLGYSVEDITKILGFEKPFDRMDTIRERLGYKKDVKNAEDAKRNQKILDYTSTLDSKEIELLESNDFVVLANVDINDKDFLAKLDKSLTEAQKEADSKPIEVSAVSAVDSMADAKTAITSLEELWNQTVKNSLSLGKDKKYLDENGNVIKQLNDKNQAVGFADPAIINSVESAFYKFSEKLKKEGNDAAANEVNQALEEFEKTLTKFPGDADKAQQAIDNLITAYIDQTDIIKNLTEENAEWSIAQLKAYGITNAEEVVMSRLSSTTKQLAKQFSVAADALTKLTNAQEDNYDETAMGTVQEQLNSMFSTELNGETISPNFDATWIIQNLELLKEAAAGSTEAMWQLQQAAAKKIAANVEINLPDQSAINGELQYINNLIDSFDISDIEVGTAIDTNPMIQGLNSLVDAGIITRDSMNAILSGIGVTPEVTYKEIQVKGNLNSALQQLENSNADYNTKKYMSQSMKNGTLGTVSVPQIQYKVGSKGVGAQYKAPSGSGSGSGGNGGSGGGNNGDKNKAKEESAESFDWIEVKIKRIEEEIARLDKSATNVYDSWTNRNKALREEMEKVTEQIKAQSVATKEYARNAELVSASGRMLTEKQNTQLEKGKKAWTDKLQQDIIDGKYTTKNKKGKKVLDTKKLKKKLGDSYSSYIKDAAQELFDLVQSNNKKKKKTKVQKNIIVDTSNKPKKSDYDNNKEFKDDLKAWKEAQTIWKSGKYQKKIREGTMTGKDIEDITNKYLVDAINKETEIVQKEIDAKDKIQELRIELANLNKQELDDIIKKWDQLIELSEKQISLIDTYISRVETAGYWVTEKPYQDQRDILTQKEADAQQKYIDAVAKYEEWRKKELDKGGFDPQGEAARDAQAEIMEAYNGLQNIKNEIVEIDKKIRELPWERFDWLEEELEDIKNEAEALSELLTLDKTMNDFGYFNERGMANLAMLGVEYEETARKVQDYAKQREQLAKDLEADPLLAYNKDYLAEVDKINQGYRDSYKELGSILQNISSTFQESIDQNLSNLKKLMDEYKETLSAAKNLYDYQKNISNQTDNITKLRKQLLAYQGDDSEAGRKRRQELTNQLNAAEQQLQETEWDRYISQTGEMLDNLYADYEQLLNSKLENITALIGDLIYEVNNNPKLVAEGIESILKLFGIETDHFDSFTKNDGQKILSAINNGKLAEDNSKILEETKEQKQKLLDMIYALDTNSQVVKSLFGNDKTLSFDRETGALLVKDVSNESAKTPEQKLQDELNTDTAKKKEEAQTKPMAGVNGGMKSLIPGVADQDFIIFDEKLTQEADRIYADLQKKKQEYDRLYTQWLAEKDVQKKQKLAVQKDSLSAEIEKLKKKLDEMNYGKNLTNFSYAKGSKSIPSNRWAWTQENGEELIFRRSDGAMLTPLGQGSMVFTNEMSKRLWEIASGNVPSILGDTKLPNINSNIHSNLTQNNTISISLPNVQDYESFKTALQNDTRFEKFVQEITIGQAMGNNTLNKRKY